MKTNRMFIGYIFLSLILVYFIILTVIYFAQRSLLYHPSENNYLDENKLNHKIEKIKIPSDYDLTSWYFKKNESFKTLLFFHGNAGSLENRIYKLNDLSKLNLNYLIVAYRGFSGNKGNPTEEGLYEDARSAIKWLKLQGIDEKSIILYGESLGTGVATEVAQNKNFAGIILESPFTSMIDAGKDKYPYLPVRFLLKDKYESDKKIKNIKSPILIMHGKVDKIVPFSMGNKMYELANTPKYSYFSEYDDHMMEYNESLLNSLKKFIYSLK